jgi:hypothetical protein
VTFNLTPAVATTTMNNWQQPQQQFFDMNGPSMALQWQQFAVNYFNNLYGILF